MDVTNIDVSARIIQITAPLQPTKLSCNFQLTMGNIEVELS